MSAPKSGKIEDFYGIRVRFFKSSFLIADFELVEDSVNVFSVNVFYS